MLLMTPKNKNVRTDVCCAPRVQIPSIRIREFTRLSHFERTDGLPWHYCRAANSARAIAKSLRNLSFRKNSLNQRLTEHPPSIHIGGIPVYALWVDRDFRCLKQGYGNSHGQYRFKDFRVSAQKGSSWQRAKSACQPPAVSPSKRRRFVVCVVEQRIEPWVAVDFGPHVLQRAAVWPGGLRKVALALIGANRSGAVTPKRQIMTSLTDRLVDTHPT